LELLRGGQRLVEPAAAQQHLDVQPLEIDRVAVGEQLRGAGIDGGGLIELPRALQRVGLAAEQVALAGGVPRSVRERDLVELGRAAERERFLDAQRRGHRLERRRILSPALIGSVGRTRRPTTRSCTT
jgi:hypothetical protein